MRILICQAQFSLGGTETYTATVAEQLENLGHSVSVHAVHATEQGRELASVRGLRLKVGPDLPAEPFDAAIVQDTGAAYLLAGWERRPRQLFVIHGMASFERPAVALDPPPPIVALNDRIARRARSFPGAGEVLRLRQPIDLLRYRPRESARPRARRVLVLSNGLNGWRLRMLAEVCAELGLELDRVGGPDGPNVQPEPQLAAADIVVGYGRSVLEGMAMGKAAYVWDRAGGDGWVTPDSYAELEADGFAGAVEEEVIDRARLSDDLASYRPELGDLAYDLVRQHHSATKHAEALLECLTGTEPPVAPDGHEAIAMLVRAERRATSRAEGAEHGNAEIWKERLRVLERAERAETKATELQERLSEAERRLHEVLGSHSWRATAALRRFGQRLRRR